MSARPAGCSTFSGVVQGEEVTEQGWRLAIDAPLARLQALYGLPDGDGSYLRRALARGPAAS